MTADQIQLLTAAVDGELSAPEARAFRLLLATSAEARTLLARLQADSDRVRALPPVAPPADLQAKIFARLASAARVEPKCAPAPKLSRRVLAWAPVACAASVFLCLAAASFAYFTAPAASKGGVAKNHWANALPAPHRDAAAVPSPTARPDPARDVHPNVPPVAPAPRALLPEVVAVAPAPRGVPAAELIGFPVLPKLLPFDRVEVRVPFLRPVADLGRADVSQELLAELRHEPALKFDLFVRDPARGVEVFQRAAKAAGLTVFADAATLDRLKRKHVHAVVIYAESLTPAELAALFAKLSAEDAKFSPRVCDALHATAVARAEELELKAVLGVDVGLFKRPHLSGAGPGGAPKSVSAGTIDSVVKSVSKAGDKSAVLMTWQTAPANLPRTNPAQSADLKHYLAKRGDRKPGAVPAIIVIRPAG